jgi:hypothetical protein
MGLLVENSWPWGARQSGLEKLIPSSVSESQSRPDLHEEPTRVSGRWVGQCYSSTVADATRGPEHRVCINHIFCDSTVFLEFGRDAREVFRQQSDSGRSLFGGAWCGIRMGGDAQLFGR